MHPIRITRAVAQVLARFLDDPAHPQWGYGLMQTTGLPSGKVYPILARLEAAGWIARESDGPEPPRIRYRLDKAAAEPAWRELDEFRQQISTPMEAAQ